MYHYFVRRQIQRVFRHLNAGDFEFVLAQFTRDGEHWFSGRHALSGTRRSAQLRQAWYQRLAALLPGIQFELKRVVVGGPPWRTHVAAEWSDHVFDRRGVALEPNQGVFSITLRWGRAVELHVYCDTQALERNLATLAAQGVAEALLPPLTSAEPPAQPVWLRTT